MKSKLLLLLFITSTLFADYYSDQGNKDFKKKYYKRAVDNYKKSKNPNKRYINLKLVNCYINLGKNFYKIREYKKAFYWFNEAELLNKGIADKEIAKIYEQFGDRFARAHNYPKALKFYKKSLELNSKKLYQKIKHVEERIEHKKKLGDDTRKVVTKDSPKWTQSIGKLLIPTKLQFINDKRYTVKTKKCSATLVNINQSKSSSIIITASHCLTMFNKKAGQLKFTIKNKKNNMIYRIASVDYDSNFDIKKMEKTTDFAILSLNKPISIKDVEPMIVGKESFSTLQKKSTKSFGSLAGFSSDIAKYGANLTYDPHCQFSFFDQMYGASTCSGFKGASGGPMVLTTTNDNKNFQYHFVGVVSHFRDKNFKNIFFAPHHQFFDTLKSLVIAFNYPE